MKRFCGIKKTRFLIKFNLLGIISHLLVANAILLILSLKKIGSSFPEPQRSNTEKEYLNAYLCNDDRVTGGEMMEFIVSSIP